MLGTDLAAIALTHVPDKRFQSLAVRMALDRLVECRKTQARAKLGTPPWQRRPRGPGARRHGGASPVCMRRRPTNAMIARWFRRCSPLRNAPEMALRLGKFCGNGPDLWISMRQAYDLWQAKKRIGEAVGRIRGRTRIARDRVCPTIDVAIPVARRSSQLNWLTRPRAIRLAFRSLWESRCQQNSSIGSLKGLPAEWTKPTSAL